MLADIINILADESSSLSSALLKTKVILYKIGSKELVDWVNYELNGYPSVDDLPEYRVIPCQVVGNVSNIRWQAKSHPIPIGHLTEQEQDTLTRNRATQSIAVLEDILKRAKNTVSRPIPMEANSLLDLGLGNGFRVQNAWAETSVHDLRGIITQVRSRLLDFMLELRDNVGEIDPEGETDTKSFDVRGAFQHSIFGANTTFGANATILVGHHSAIGEARITDVRELAAGVQKLVADVERLLPTSDLAATERRATEVALAELREAAVVERPDAGRLKRGLEALQHIMEHTAGHLLAAGVLAVIPGLLASAAH